MIRALMASAALAATPLAAQDIGSLRDRIDALKTPEIVLEDPYAEDIARDLEMIGQEAGSLFPNDESIALFIGPDCPKCATVRAELLELTDRLGVAMHVIDIDEAGNAALMERITLDTVPSYVMPDRLIRGEMPVFVLEKYLRDKR